MFSFLKHVLYSLAGVELTPQEFGEIPRVLAHYAELPGQGSHLLPHLGKCTDNTTSSGEHTHNEYYHAEPFLYIIVLK